MGRIVSDRLLSTIGRAPGTSPAPDQFSHKDQKELIRAKWEEEFLLAVANIALARDIARRALLTRVTLDLLAKTSVPQIPPLAKRNDLQRKDLIRGEIVGADGHWDVTPVGMDRLQTSALVASIPEEVVRAILKRHKMAA